LALISVVVAGVLNIVPVVEKAKFHGEMFRAWSELRKDGVLEQQKTCGEEPQEHHVNRLAELTGKMESLHTMEPFAEVALLQKCQEDENEAEWGTGIRTHQQVEAEMARRTLAPAGPAAPASPVALAAGAAAVVE
jgi:hypothetical protein